MSDGSDGAGGVGGGGNSGANGAESAADSIGAAAEAAAEALGAAISEALSGLADAAGLSDALGGFAEALGLDAKALEGILGAAAIGFATGGLPGAVMGVVNGLVGGSIADAARDAVSANLPSAMQPFANMAIDTFASRVPGANTSVQSALGAFASGALTNGRAPDIGDLGAVARSLSDVQSAARSALDVVTSGHFSSVQDAVSSLDGSLQSQFDVARAAAGGVVGAMERGLGTHPSGQTGFAGVVEQLAVDTAQMMMRR